MTSTVILLRQVAVGDGGGHVGDVADLAGEVASHGVDVVGEVLPGAGDAGHIGLTAELAFGSDFASHAGDFGGEGVELVDHRVDGVLEFENFAFHIDGDLARQIAVGDGGRDFGDVANLVGEVAAIELTLSVRSFQVPATPGTTAWPPSLPSVPTSRATRLTSEAKALSWSTIVLMVFLSSRISPLTSTVILRDRSPFGDSRRDFGDVADLSREVGGHRS